MEFVHFTFEYVVGYHYVLSGFHKWARSLAKGVNDVKICKKLLKKMKLARSAVVAELLNNDVIRMVLKSGENE